MYTNKAVKVKDIVASHFVSTFGQACLTVGEVEKISEKWTLMTKRQMAEEKLEELFNTPEKPPRYFTSNFIIRIFILQTEFAVPKDLHSILAVEIYKQLNKKVYIQRVNLYNRTCFLL